MIVLLLLFSTNLLANDNDSVSFPFTGVLIGNNYAVVSYDALRIANAKMVELEYEKEINVNLKQIIIEDSITINKLKNYIETAEINHNEEVKTLRKKFFISTGCGAGVLVLLILSLL